MDDFDNDINSIKVFQNCNPHFLKPYQFRLSINSELEQIELEINFELYELAFLKDIKCFYFDFELEFFIQIVGILKYCR